MYGKPNDFACLAVFLEHFRRVFLKVVILPRFQLPVILRGFKTAV